MLYNRQISEIRENGKRLSIISLGIPLLLESIFNLLYGTLNTVILSGYSATAVSAASVGNQLLDIGNVTVNMLVKGTVIVLSVAFGSRDIKKAERVAGNGFVCVLITGVIFGIIFFLGAGRLIEYMKLESEAACFAEEYLKIYAVFFPVTALLSYINNLLICNGYTRHSMFSGIFSNFLSVVLSYFALYGNLNLKISAIVSVACAGVIAKSIGLIISCILYFRAKSPFKLSFQPSVIFSIAKFGVPAGMCLFSYSLSQTVTTSFITALGITVINTKVYISGIVAYVSKGSYALGSAGSIIMGRYKGAGESEKTERLFKQNVLLAVLLNLMLSCLCFVFYKDLMRIFTDETEILKSAGIIFFIDIFVEIARGINHISENALNSNGDVRFTLVVSLISCWGFSVLLSYILCCRFKLGLVGLWVAFLTDEAFRAAVYLLRWKSKKWMNNTI